MQVEEKLPPKGLVELIIFNKDTSVLRIKRNDGKELGARLDYQDLANFIEYAKAILSIMRQLS